MFKATLVLVTMIVLTVIGVGLPQEVPQQKASPTPMVSPTPEPSLDLTAPEKEFLKQLSLKLQPTQQGLQAAWNSLLTTEDEKEAINLWLRARLLNIKAQDIQKEFTEWFDKIKVIHKCLDCNLQGDKLIRPEPPREANPKKP